MKTILAAWIVRALLGACLLFGAEIALWTAPTRALPDWPPLALGYVALAAAALDMGRRFHVRDIFGLLLLAGLYASAASLLLFPQSALADIPVTLVTRALGAYTVAGVLALAAFLMLLGAPQRRRLLLACGVGGLAWGAWVHGLPELTTGADPDPLPLMLLAGVIGLALIGGLRWLIVRLDAPHAAADLQLGVIGWALTAAALVWNGARSLDNGAVDTLGLVVCVALAAYIMVILWFQKRGSGTLFDAAFPPLAVEWRTLGIAAGLVLAGSAAGYVIAAAVLPDTSLAAALVGVFTAWGLVWLPTVSLVLGVDGWRRLTRQRRL